MSLIGNTVSLPDTLLGLEGLLFIDTKLNVDEQVRQSTLEIEAGLGINEGVCVLSQYLYIGIKM